AFARKRLTVLKGGSDLLRAKWLIITLRPTKRLLYLTYPRVKLMPWGDYKAQQASRFVSMSGIS
ncbi:hypothetical protein A8F31_13020, partial [Burkholderia cenocepacia]